MYDTWMTAEHISKKYRKETILESQSMHWTVALVWVSVFDFKYLLSNMIQLVLLSLQSSRSSFTFPVREHLVRYRLKWSIQMGLSSQKANTGCWAPLRKRIWNKYFKLMVSGKQKSEIASTLTQRQSARNYIYIYIDRYKWHQCQWTLNTSQIQCIRNLNRDPTNQRHVWTTRFHLMFGSFI